MQSYIKNQKGSVAIIALLGFILCFMLLALTGDVCRFYSAKIYARQSLNLALRAACSQIDMDALADAENPQVIILENPAQASFLQTLRDNLRLDAGNNPLTSSIADSKVEICYFKVINSSDIPYSYTYASKYSETINKVSATGIIRVPIRTSAFGRLAGLPQFSDLYVHATVGPEIMTQL